MQMTTRALLLTALPAALMLATATPAAAFGGEYNQGQWSIMPETNFCSAINLALSTPDSALIMVTGDGSNDGGLMFSAPLSMPYVAGPAQLSITIGDAEPVMVEAEMMHTPRGFWLPWGATSDLPKLPDDFRLTVKQRDTLIFDGELTGFKAFVTEVNDCDKRASP